MRAVPQPLQAAHDPMIELARMIDGPARAARKVYEAQDETKQQAYAAIAKARFADRGNQHLSGCDVHPAIVLWCSARLRAGR